MTSDTLILPYLKRLHDLAEAQADDLRPGMNRIMKSSPVDSPTDQDLKWVLRSARSEDRRELWGRAQQACLHMAVNVADHVRSVAVLLSQPSVGVPIYAHSSLARVAIESAANAAHILDRNAPFPVRLGRGIALLISDSDKARLTADRVPGNRTRAGVRQPLRVPDLPLPLHGLPPGPRRQARSMDHQRDQRC